MASSLVATASIGRIIGSDLPEADLDILVDGAEAAIRDVIGGSVEANEQGRTYKEHIWPPVPYLWLPHRAASVQTVKLNDDTLEATDYEIVEEGSALRLERGSTIGYYGSYGSDGTRWAGDVEVAFTRVRNAELWTEALVDLVRVAAGRMGVTSDRLGPVATTAADSDALRERILDRLRMAEPLVAVA